MDKDKKIVGIVGHCGIGKTSLLEKLMKIDKEMPIVKLKDEQVDLKPEFQKLVNENWEDLV